MKIDLTKCTAVAKNLMVSRGAPKSVFRFNMELNSSIILDAKHEKRSVPSLVQLSKYEKCWSNPIGPWLLVIGSSIDEDYAMVAAIGLMWQATIKNAKDPMAYSRPFLWRLFGGNYDKLRQNDDFRSGVGSIGLLIMNNLAENSTLDKIEKCRDLIALYPDTPRVVVVAGEDPLKFSLDRLHINPTRVLHLGRKRKVRQI